jgi:GMP synthase (glutamine-hydrolysing)
MKKPIAIIEMGTSPEIVIKQVGPQSQWFIDALDWQPEQYRIYRPEWQDALPTKDEVSCVIISGSWSMVTEKLDWSERVAEWVRQAMDLQIPILGVCYGHQLMAYALGGKVIDNPKGAEQGMHLLSQGNTNTVTDPLLDGISSEFPAWLCHYQTVSQPPQGAEVLLKSEQDDHQMLRYNSRTYSVQFHPEFSRQTMAACYQAEDKLNSTLENELACCAEPEQALTILRRFTEIWS